MPDRQQMADRLREASARLSMKPSEKFEADAELFYRETGFMAPGKSMPLEMYQGEDHERRRHEAWGRWMGGRVATFQSDLEAGAAALAREQWRPIETAPQDGTWFLAWDRDCEFYVYRMGPGFYTGEDPTPTHWMPLPEIPHD